MTRFNVSAKEEGFGLVPEGTYEARIKTAVEKQSQAGNDMWEISLQIVSGEFAGRIIYDRLVFSPKAISRVRQFCDACGYVLPETGEVEMITGYFLDRRVGVVIVHEEWNGKNRDKVSFDGYLKPAAGNETKENIAPPSVDLEEPPF